MLNQVIDFSLRHRFLVLLAVAAVAAAGVYAMFNLDIDAFPDTTPVQVQINTVVPTLGPEDAERQITFPIEQALGGMPRLESLRSISKFGLSQVVVAFEDGTDIYFARQLVNERLLSVELPEGSPRPELGPVSTGLGEVFHYMVTGKGDEATSLRTIHDWVIKPKMRTAKGVAEVNSWGGYEKQYQIRLDPDAPRQVRPDVRRGGRGRPEEQPQRRRRQHPPGRRHAPGPGRRPHRQRGGDPKSRRRRQGRRAGSGRRRGRRGDRPRDPPRAR